MKDGFPEDGNSLHVQFGGRYPTAGDVVEFRVDGGRPFPMKADADGGLDVECRSCLSEFVALWKAVMFGENMSVRSRRSGETAVFDIRGEYSWSGVERIEEVCLPG